MLLNLSNHPVENWSEKQITEAEKLYGKIIDLPFPQIDPTADENEIEKLSMKYLQLCAQMLRGSKDETNAVHLMGELTFTFSLANKLLTEGITVVASTTERNSVEINGKKITEFQFVKFRKYKI